LIRVLRVLGYAAFGLGVLAYPLAFAMDRAAGIEALVVTASDDASVAANRGLWELDGKPKDGVAAIYGTPSKTPARLVGAPADRILHPKEDPSLTLYLLRTGDHPLQAMTLYYFALPATLGGLVAGTALLWYVCRRKKSAPAAAATPAA
jgi:hypothetical protein